MSRDGRTLTFNSSDGGVNLKSVGNPIVQPYAQIVMVNANHGDCNVVDLCRVRIANGAYVPDPDNKMSYSRSIIDVGPNKATLKALEAVLTNVGQPKFTVPHSGNVSTPIGYDEALVDMLQFTHIDEDHCGMGVELIADVLKAAQNSRQTGLSAPFQNTSVAYHELPPISVDFVLALRPGPNDNLFPAAVTCRYGPVGHMNNSQAPSIWLGQLGAAGTFRLVYTFRLQLLEAPNQATVDGDWHDIQGHTMTDSQCVVPLQYSAMLDPTMQRILYRYVAIACFVQLQSHRKDQGHSNFNAWRYLTCTQANAAGNNNLPVQWLPNTVYQLVAPAYPQPNSLVGMRMLPGAALHGAGLEDLGLGSTFDFVRIAAALETVQAASAASQWGRSPFQALRFPPVQGTNMAHMAGQEWDVSFTGPTPALYAELMRQTTLTRFRAAKTNPNSPDGGVFGPHAEVTKANVGGLDISNRASVLTHFATTLSTPSEAEAYSARFTMLFTGDAYDRDCDIQNTIPGAAGVGLPKTYIDVLKVPHHCSANTSDGVFYQTVLAHVYLICAQQTKHGNPSLGTLRALASTFAQPVEDYNRNGSHTPWPPRLLFFSDPNALTPAVTGEASNVYHLLNDAPERPFLPGLGQDARSPVYNYRCFRLRQSASATATTAGRILLGRDDQGNLTVQLSVAPNEADTTDYWLNDWVEMTGPGSPLAL